MRLMKTNKSVAYCDHNHVTDLLPCLWNVEALEMIHIMTPLNTEDSEEPWWP